MANKKFLMGILVMTLVFGMALVGCASGADSIPTGADPVLNGTWISTTDGIKFDNGSFENNDGENPLLRGTYTASGGSIRMEVTQYYGSNPLWKGLLQSRWYTKDQIKATFGDSVSDSQLNGMFKTITGKYSISGSVLTFRGGLSGKYLRQSGQYMLVNSDTLNVRNGPSADNAIVGTLARNTRVEVIDRSAGTWLKIKSGSIEGYVNSSYLKDE
jgi:hypothetical protein